MNNAKSAINPTVAAALKRCSSEAIHLPGTIQPQGFLIAADAAAIIRYASANVSLFLDAEVEDLIGRPLSAVFGPVFAGQVMSLPQNNEQVQVHPVCVELAVSGGARFFCGQAHHFSSLFFVELESAERQAQHQVFDGLFVPVRDQLWALDGEDDLTVYLSAVADQVAVLTGFDRVMVYRFDSKWDGEVVAEARHPDMQSYLGNHFPAADIPPQARALYMKNRIRLIADVHAAPVPIYPLLQVGTDRPLDLSFAALRSFSPVHLEYLRNMGVGASFSISLISQGRLWGLIACHHRSRMTLAPNLRELADFIGRTASMKIGEIEQKEKVDRTLRAQKAISELAASLLAEPANAPASTELTAGSDLLRLFGASSMVICQNQRKFFLGQVPCVALLNHLTNWLRTLPPADVYATDALTSEFPDADAWHSIAHGLLVTPVTPDMANYVMWFRPQIMRSIKWAGNPEKLIELVDDGVRISPRKSFATWLQSYGDNSAPWSFADIDVAQHIALDLMTQITQGRLQRTSQPSAHNDFADAQGYTAELSPAGQYRWVAPQCAQVLGFLPQELVDHPISDFVFADDIEGINRYLARCLDPPPPGAGFSVRHSGKGGSYVWLELNAEFDATRGLLKLSARDVSERQRYNEALEGLHQRHHRILDQAREGVLRLDAAGRIAQANDAAHVLLNYAPGDLLGQPAGQLLASGPSTESEMTGAQAEAIDYRQAQLRLANGEMLPVKLWTLRIDAGVASTSGSAATVLVFRPATPTAELADATAPDLPENQRTGVFITDGNGVIQAVNAGFSRITGYTADEAVGNTPALLRANVHSREFYKQFWRTLAEHRIWRGEIWNRRKNGEVYAQFGSVFSVSQEPAGAVHYIAMFRDVSTARRVDEKMHLLPEHDALTGLPGRLLFEQSLSRRLLGGADGPLAVAFFDLRNFKAINDALGHISGDRLLYFIVTRLQRELRERDILARWGGDKFVLLLADLAGGRAASPPEVDSEAEAIAVVQRLLRTIAAPFAIAGRQVTPSACVGLSLYPRDGKNVADLMRAADSALNRAKSESLSDICVFNEALFASSRQRF